MTTLQRFAASTLRVSARPTLSQRAPVLVRRETAGHNPGMAAGGQQGRPAASPSDAPTGKLGDSDMIRQQGPVEGQPDHNPDYDVTTDYRVS